MISEAKTGGVVIHMKLMGLPARQGTQRTSIRTPSAKAQRCTSAGGHFNPEVKMHGLDSENGVARRRCGELPRLAKKVRPA